MRMIFSQIYKSTLAVALLLSLSVLLLSCDTGSAKFKQPKFVKEWEVKEIVPGADHRVLDITANKYGVFALVETSEFKWVYAKKWAEMTEEERTKAIKKLEGITGHPDKDEETFNKEAYLLNKSGDINTYQIQQYDHNGNFIKAWPENNNLNIDDVRDNTKEIPVSINDWRYGVVDVDSRSQLINPIRIASNEKGDIYVADYAGNKIAIFDHDGNVKNFISIDRKGMVFYDDIAACKGLTLRQDLLSLVYRPGYEIETFHLAIYNATDGSTKSDIKYPLPEIRPFISPPVADSFKMKLPLKKLPALINDIAVDKDGNYYLLVGMQSIVKYDSDFREIKSFDVVLKEGFNTDVEYTDHMTGEKKKYGQDELSLLGSFDTQMAASFGESMRGPGYYDLGRVYVTPANQIIITFIGSKPFGEMVAVAYDLEGNQIGYWKTDRKSGSEWFKGLVDLAKLQYVETDDYLAYYGDDIFEGKTIAVKGFINKYTKD